MSLPSAADSRSGSSEPRDKTASPRVAGNESLLSFFIDAIPDYAYMKDLSGRYVAINAAAARFLRKSPAEIIGQDDFDLFPLESAQRMVEEDRAVLASEGSLSFDHEVPENGVIRQMQTVKSVCRDHAGTVIGVVGISRDVGERKNLERILRQREHELSEAQRLASIGSWRWERATDTVTWSDETYRIFGRDRSLRPATSQEILALNGSDSLRQLGVAFDRALRFGEPYSIDVEIGHRDRPPQWISARGEVESWEDGQVASLRGTVQEITERKRHEEQLALSENRYRSLVHATSQVVWVTNAPGNHMDVTSGWQAFTGQSDGEVLGYGWTDAVHPDIREAAVKKWRYSVETGTPFKMEQRVRRHDGVYRDMAVHAVPVRDAWGQIVEWVGTHSDITDQRRAEDEIRLAHQRLQNVLDSITDGLCVLDRDWRCIYCNENGARMTGCSVSDIIGKRVGDIFRENEINGFRDACQRAYDTGETVHFEQFYGEPLNTWFECNCYPSADGLTVYFRDVTERKKFEEALQDSESRYRKLFESNMMGIARPDRFGAFKDGNDELLRMTGYTREELDAGLVRWDTMTPAEYAETDQAHIAEAAQRGSCTPYEKEYIRKDGSRVPILCGYALLEGSQDEYVGFVFDLTRQRAAEAGLREREQRFRVLAESLPQLVWTSDAVGSLTYLNQRFLDYCGISLEGMVGFDWQKILHPEETERVNHAWWSSVNSGSDYLIELQLLRHDGEYRHFLAHSLPMRNEAGEVERWVGSCTDIHDQKHAEEALRRSEKLAATGRLAASIAHEINNPLTSVINSLYLALQDGSLATETRRFLETAEGELARISQITTQTLRFHRQSKAPAFADLSEIMQSVLTLFGPRLTSRQIKVVSECDRGVRIWCFEDELRQVFANLVSNSLDAIADGGSLRIRVRASHSNGVGGVRVTVADNGCGIPPAIRKRIFEPFFSTKETTGIGLGLWVSDGVIRKHSARLRLRSCTGRQHHGTVFSVFLPENGVEVPHLRIDKVHAN